MSATGFGIPVSKTITAYNGETGQGAPCSDTSATTFTFSSNNRQNRESRYVVIGVCSNQTAARTISSVTFSFDGGSAVAATQLVTSGASSTTPCGIYVIDISSCFSSYDITVTFSGSVRGCMTYFLEFPDFPGGGVATYTEVVNGTSPLSSTSRSQTREEVMFAIGTHRGAGTIGWEYGGGSVLILGNFTYQTRTGAALYATPSAMGNQPITDGVYAEWSAGGFHPEFVVAYIT